MAKTKKVSDMEYPARYTFVMLSAHCNNMRVTDGILNVADAHFSTVLPMYHSHLKGPEVQAAFIICPVSLHLFIPPGAIAAAGAVG